LKLERDVIQIVMVVNDRKKGGFSEI